MKVFKISFTYPAESDLYDMNENVMALVSSLIYNGQILSEPIVYTKNQTYHIMLTCPENNSLNKEYWNKNVTDIWNEIEKSMIHLSL
jgi:predicted  nucleic acid-binding Zn ribbon protein